MIIDRLGRGTVPSALFLFSHRFHRTKVLASEPRNNAQYIPSLAWMWTGVKGIEKLFDIYGKCAIVSVI